MNRLPLILLLLLAAAATALAAEPDSPRVFTPQQVEFFEEQVLPILRANCFECHGGQPEIESNFRITSRSGLLRGGEIGPAVDLENPQQSDLLSAVRYEGLEMPPSGQLTGEQIDVLARWVKMGLPWSKTEDYGVTPKTVEDTRGDGRDYWAYQAIVRPPAPAVKNAAWISNPIDAFILARLEAAGLQPAPPADKVALIRRAYYDLTGLPPSPEEIDRFLQDDSPQAFQQVVDRLLESPQYGERWGRHWLDLVRYAETHGYERDSPKPQAWRYRDYVIQSFSDDKPYDQFVIEQLAGDELPEVTAESLTATGYYRLGLWDDEPVDRELARYDGLDDILKTTSEAVLGTTMGCARCHSHKADPIDHAEYYQLLAYFHDIKDSTKENLRYWATDEDRQMERRRRREKAEREEAWAAEIQSLENEEILGADKAARLAELQKALSKSRKEQAAPAGTAIMAVAEDDNGPVHVLARGNPHAKGRQVEPGVPAMLGTAPPEIPESSPGPGSSGKRLALARWMFQQDNPLTARVIANRIWQHHFGRGIVPTPNDFGKLGERPTHPQLLDYLAAEIRDGGWKLKPIHRLILLSSAWQMSSQASPQGLERDPGNERFWRFNMRRLSSEEVRDSMLAVSGELHLKQGGPSVYVPIPEAVLQGQSRPGDGWGESPPRDAARRSVYIHAKRSLMVPILQMHDQAHTDSSCPVRYITTVPTQSLGMLNGEFVNRRAAALAERLRREHPADGAAQIRRAIRLTTGRTPDDEVARDLHLLGELRSADTLTEEQALKMYCLLALNTNAFIYLD